MRAEEKKLLLDVSEACQSIEQRCAGHTFDGYTADRWFRRAVEREFEIIGEALNRLDPGGRDGGSHHFPAAHRGFPQPHHPRL